MLVCFALKEEAAPFRKIAADRPEISILVTGIGWKNAERVVSEFLASTTPSHILTCGFAGGLDPNLAVGAVLFETDDAGLRETLTAAGAKPGRFVCATRIATTAKEKQELRCRTAADAVEMESGAIHFICSERSVVCATVRVISDVAADDLPLDFNQLAGADLNLDYGKLALAVAKSPGKVGPLLRLQRQTRYAAEKLAEVLGKVI
jgi:nucleoside phosphorylase